MFPTTGYITPLRPISMKISENNYVFKPELITTFFLLIREELKIVFELINTQYHAIEKSEKPAKGYVLHIREISKSKPMEFVLEAVGIRSKDEIIKMPEEGETCSYCTAPTSLGFKSKATDKARVICIDGKQKSINHSTSSTHSRHFFEMKIDEQVDLTMKAIEILKPYKLGTNIQKQIIIPIGAEGRQVYPHAYADINLKYMRD